MGDFRTPAATYRKRRIEGGGGVELRLEPVTVQVGRDEGVTLKEHAGSCDKLIWSPYEASPQGGKESD